MRGRTTTSLTVVISICCVVLFSVSAQATNGYVDHVSVTYVKNGSKIYDQTVPHGGTFTFDAGTDFAILIYRGGGSSPWKFYCVGPGYDQEHESTGSYSAFTPLYDEGKWFCKVDNGTWQYIFAQAAFPQPPQKATNPSPVNGGVSINADLSWSNGGGATSYDVYFGTDSSPDSGEFKGNQTGTTYDPGTLAYNTIYYWRINAKNSNGTTTGDVWQFTTESSPPQPPSKAVNPNPSNGATDVSINTDVSWSNGGGATSYDVYFGTDPGSLDFKGNQTSTSYNPDLTYDTTYQWRIDAKNSDGTTTGDLWQFTTVPPADIKGWVLFDHDNDISTDPVALKNAKVLLMQNHEDPLGGPQHTDNNGYFNFGSAYSDEENLCLYVYATNDIVQVNYYSFEPKVGNPYVFWKPIAGGGTYIIQMSGSSMCGGFAIFQFFNDLHVKLQDETSYSEDVPTTVEG